MTNLKTLEELRTKKEIEDYFKQLGKEITEEELDALKQSYEKAQESSGALTMQQLDDVAGGIVFIFTKETGKMESKYNDDKKKTIKVQFIDKLCGGTTERTYDNYLEFFHDFLSIGIVGLAHTNLIAHPGRYSAEFRETIMHLKTEIDKPDFHDHLLTYTLNHLFHKGVEGLCRDNSSIAEIQPYLESLQYNYNHSSPNIQRLMNIAASCVKVMDYLDAKLEISGTTFSDSSIRLYHVENDKFDKFDLLHEIFHCLDHRLNCSEHLGDKIYNFRPDEYLYRFFAANASIDLEPLKVIIPVFLNARMAQILALHRDREFNTVPEFYCAENDLDLKSRSHEMFARLCEIYVHTNGTWIIPSPVIDCKKLTPSETEKIKKDMIWALTSFLEERSGAVTRGPVQKRLRERQVKGIMENGFDVKIYFPELVRCFEAEIKDVITKVDSIGGPASFVPAKAPAVVVHPQKGKGKKKKGKKK